MYQPVAAQTRHQLVGLGAPYAVPWSRSISDRSRRSNRYGCSSITISPAGFSQPLTSCLFLAQVWVNQYNLLYNNVPFGGKKQSGIGESTCRRPRTRVLGQPAWRWNADRARRVGDARRLDSISTIARDLDADSASATLHRARTGQLRSGRIHISQGGPMELWREDRLAAVKPDTPATLDCVRPSRGPSGRITMRFARCTVTMRNVAFVTWSRCTSIRSSITTTLSANIPLHICHVENRRHLRDC